MTPEPPATFTIPLPGRASLLLRKEIIEAAQDHYQITSRAKHLTESEKLMLALKIAECEDMLIELQGQTQ